MRINRFNLDEADKAEVEVVTILKNLIDGEMTLADQRRILSKVLPFIFTYFSHNMFVS